MDALGNPPRTRQTARKSTGGCIARLKREPQLQEVERQLATTTMEPATLFSDLPAELIEHIVVQIQFVYHIARAAPTSRAISVAARNAINARQFSGEVVTLAVAVAGDASSGGLAVTPDGCIITGSWDGTVKVWRDGACERTIQAHDELLTVFRGTIESVAVLPGGERFVSVSDDGTAKLWRTLDGMLERIVLVEHGLQPGFTVIVNSVAALLDGVHFVVGLGGGPNCGDVRLYHVDDGTLVHNFQWHQATVWAVAVTPDGHYIISGSDDGFVAVWGVGIKCLLSTCEHNDSVKAVAAMPDSQRILSGSWKEVRVWHVNGTLEKTFTLHNDPRGGRWNWVNALVALPDNHHALSGSEDETIKLFNVNDGAVLRTFKNHTGPVECLALLPDGLRFVSGSDDTTCIVYHGLEP